MKQAELGKWSRMVDYFYDFTAVVISSLDIITDLLVVIVYYQEGKMVFFRIGLVLLIVAQLAYLLLFVVWFGDSYFDTDAPFWKKVLLLICVAPFVQLVPLLIWLDSYNIEYVKNFLEYFNLESADPHVHNGNQLWDWLPRKIEQHGGFVVESFLEALPQSILQISGILYYQEASVISLLSIVLSMTSVASKGLIMSYSMNWYVFVFNCLCFSADIFGTFSGLCWFFYNPSKGGLIEYDILDQLWLVQLSSIAVSFFIVLAFIIMFLFVILMIFIFDSGLMCFTYEERRIRRRSCASIATNVRTLCEVVFHEILNVICCR